MDTFISTHHATNINYLPYKILKMTKRDMLVIKRQKLFFFKFHEN